MKSRKIFWLDMYNRREHSWIHRTYYGERMRDIVKWAIATMFEMAGESYRNDDIECSILCGAPLEREQTIKINMRTVVDVGTIKAYLYIQNELMRVMTIAE